MTVKNTKPRKSHRIRTYKCPKCKNVINIDEKLELQDYEKVGSGYIFYCEKCGTESDVIKL